MSAQKKISAPSTRDKSLQRENFGIGYKVFRGGSYIFTAADLRAASRLADDPLVQSEIIGFRCAK